MIWIVLAGFVICEMRQVEWNKHTNARNAWEGARHAQFTSTLQSANWTLMTFFVSIQSKRFGHINNNLDAYECDFFLYQISFFLQSHFISPLFLFLVFAFFFFTYIFFCFVSGVFILFLFSSFLLSRVELKLFLRFGLRAQTNDRVHI